MADGQGYTYKMYIYEKNKGKMMREERGKSWKIAIYMGGAFRKRHENRSLHQIVASWFMISAVVSRSTLPELLYLARAKEKSSSGPISG